MLFVASVTADHISIHALRKESDDVTVWPLNDKEISIHALRKESDSTFRLVEFHLDISIHALRKESDALPRRHSRTKGYFNPRSP